MYQRPVTQYEFYDDKLDWLGWVQNNGNIKSAICISLCAAIHKITREEYLLDFLEKGMLCGDAEDYAIKLQKEKQENGNNRRPVMLRTKTGFRLCHEV